MSPLGLLPPTIPIASEVFHLGFEMADQLPGTGEFSDEHLSGRAA